MKFVIAAPLVFACATASAGTPAVDARQTRQDARIDHGVATGTLTRCEANRLENRTDRVRARESVYRATGGVGPAERRDLNRRLNSVSADIAEQKHDGRGCF